MAVGTPATEQGSRLEVVRVPMFSDNYGWIVRDPESGKVAAVDPAQPDVIQRALEERGWKLDYILNTHHHQDHVGGNGALKSHFKCQIVGPKADERRIPQIDSALAEGEVFKLGDIEFKVFDTPGHTTGHITYWVPDAKMLFPGDTLFAIGCGRLFEGTPAMMWNSLQKLKNLPGDTQVFCGHEYTLNNAKWAITVDPDNKDLQQRYQRIQALRQSDTPTVPSMLREEQATNPFLRPSDNAIRAALKVPQGASDEDAFAAIRGSKDSF